MPKKFPQRAEDLRRALAQEAARIMAEHGVEDFRQAKRKAADRLGVNDVAVLPKNIEIEDALRAHQRLFGRDTHDHTLREQRRIALDTMRILAEFQPRLVGVVLTGPATNYSDINLHLFADASESVAIKLLEIGVPHEFYERRVKMDAEDTVQCVERKGSEATLTRAPVGRERSISRCQRTSVERLQRWGDLMRTCKP